VLQVWFWLTPVVYPKSILSPRMAAVSEWNPVYPFMASIRTLFIDRQVPNPGLWLAMLAWTTAAGVLGYVVLRKLRSELRDVI
jgi:lipopolysaccharide transport system permease protein